MPEYLSRSPKNHPPPPSKPTCIGPLRSFAFSPGLDGVEDGPEPSFDLTKWAAAFPEVEEESIADVLRGSVYQLLCLVLVIGVSLVSNRAHPLNRQRVVSRKLLNVLTRESRPCAHV